MPVRKRRAPALLIGAASAAALALAVASSEPLSARAGGPVTVSAAVDPAELTIGASARVSGRLLDAGVPVTGQGVTLLAAAPPARAPRAIAHAVTAADGSFAFAALAPSRNEALEVSVDTPLQAESELLSVVVDPRVSLSSRKLGPGRTRLSARVVHTTEAPAGTVAAHWYVAAHGSRRFTPVANSPLRDTAAGIASAAAIVDPPSRHFAWRVCFNPPWETAMGQAGAHGPCPRHTFLLPVAKPGGRASARAHAALMYGGEASGTPAPAFPSQTAIAAAGRWLDSRAGATALAVVNSSGRLGGIRTRARFETASVIKVMFLAAYLKRLEAEHRSLGAGDRALLYPMIHESNNDAASAVLGVVGEAAVERVAARVGMRDYAPGVGWWAFSQTSAADQAQLLWHLGEVMPPRFYAYARYLMSTIEPEQSWGFPPVARPAWQVYFKTGALPSRGLFNEVARLERGGVAFSVAVLSDHEPSQAYGEQTIAGVARALLGNG